MGEAKRRKSKDPNYGKPKSYMSYLELPLTDSLVTYRELKQMITSLKKESYYRSFHATVIKDHTERWHKIEKLCIFIEMEKILDHNPNKYGTESIFVTKNYSKEDRSRLIKYYSNKNLEGFSFPPPPMSVERVKQVLTHSQNHYEELLEAEDVECIFKSNNCATFYIPVDLPELEGLCYVNFFTRLQLQSE